MDAPGLVVDVLPSMIVRGELIMRDGEWPVLFLGKVGERTLTIIDDGGEFVLNLVTGDGGSLEQGRGRAIQHLIALMGYEIAR